MVAEQEQYGGEILQETPWMSNCNSPVATMLSVKTTTMLFPVGSGPDGPTSNTRKPSCHCRKLIQMDIELDLVRDTASSVWRITSLAMASHRHYGQTMGET